MIDQGVLNKERLNNALRPKHFFIIIIGWYWVKMRWVSPDTTTYTDCRFLLKACLSLCKNCNNKKTNRKNTFWLAKRIKTFSSVGKCEKMRTNLQNDELVVWPTIWWAFAWQGINPNSLPTGSLFRYFYHGAAPGENLGRVIKWREGRPFFTPL